MEWSLYAPLLFFLASAIGIVPLCHALRIHPTVAYIVAGILMGPFGFGLIPMDASIQHFSELGLVFLLFFLGLELTLERIKKTPFLHIYLAIFQMVFCALAGYGVATLFQVEPIVSLLVASCFSFSSTALCIKLLSDKKEQLSPHGQLSISILLIQDLAVVPLIALIPILSMQKVSIHEAVLDAFLKATFAILLIFLTGRFFMRYIYRLVGRTKNSELFTAATLFILLGLSLFTSHMGLSMALGAFLAGLLLAETEYHHQVFADLYPFQGILLGLFFTTMGTQIDPVWTLNHLSETFIWLLALIVYKVLIMVILCLFLGYGRSNAIRSAFLLAQSGEFVFVVLSQAQAGGLLRAADLQLFFSVTVLSMMLTPLLNVLGQRLNDWMALKTSKVEQDQLAAPLSNHVVLIGFGRLGHHVAQILEHHGITYVAIDSDHKIVAKAREKKYPVYYGDASNISILKSFSLDEAKACIITIDNAGLVFRLGQKLNYHYPELPLILRARDCKHLNQLEEIHQADVVLEDTEVSLQIAYFALEKIGIITDDILETMDRFRKDNYALLNHKDY